VNACNNERDVAIVQAMEWILRLEASPSDSGLEREFHEWLARADEHREAYQAAQQTWAALGKLDDGVSIAKETTNNVAQFSARKPRRARWISAAAALVAACVVIAALPIIQKHLASDYITGVAELRTITLPDGSVVYLDAGSAIAVKYDGAERQIVLVAGQVFFDVARDQERLFKVVADEISVVVKGTTFSVRKAPTAVSVAVQSGTVDVVVKGSDTINRLTMGDTLAIDQQTRTASRGVLSPALVASWRSGRLVVHDALFEDIVEEIGRHLPGVIIIRDRSLNREVVTGTFDVSRPLEAISTLADSQGAYLTQITPYLLVVSRR